MSARPVAFSRGLRLLRGALLAGTAVALAVAAHRMSGGDAPDTGLILLSCLAIGWVGTAVSDRRHDPVAIIGALGTSQVVLHVLLSMPGELSAHHPAPVTGVGPLMLPAHALATLLTGLLLTTADAALLAVVAAIRAVLPRRPLPLPAGAPLPTPVATARTDIALDLLLTRICARRGPPRAV